VEEDTLASDAEEWLLFAGGDKVNGKTHCNEFAVQHGGLC